ncbi:class I adenylate-forming enzyme family protein [Pseudonocardia sp. GCM10023141]|uniref:class I adenylate-forming enzyme family protein n=1 Tax=Pseudonocardia sp. GCM10023141 TaxID=3252653 RepID=UPI0036D43360
MRTQHDSDVGRRQVAGRKMHPQERITEYVERGWWTGVTVQQLFADRVAELGPEPAVIDPANKVDLLDTAPQRATWDDLDTQVEQLAAVLLAHGIGEGDVLAVQLPNTVELVVAYLAAWRVRAIVSPLPVQYRRHEIVELATIGAVAAFLTADRIGKRAAAAEVVALRPEIASLHTVLHVGPSPVPGSVGVGDAVAGLTDGHRAAVAAYADAHPVDPNDCLTICWTSGTESRPKGVPRAHYEWLTMTSGTVEAPGLTRDSVLLNPFPMVNMAGISGMFLPWLRVGCVLVQHHPFDLAVFLAQVRDERVTYTVAPPALLAMLLQHEELLAGADLSSLRHVGSGSAPLQEWMVRGWHERLGISVINFFGSNEGIALMTDVVRMTDPAQRARFFPRYGGGREWSFAVAQQTTVKLVDPDTGAIVEEPGRPGELHLKGPSVFAGYLDAAALPDPFDADGFLRTGDVFVIDGPNGEFLRYVDRAKDLIIRGGTNIAPAELETMIASHPAVADVAVVGYPDDVLGERVAAVVATRAGQSITLADVIAHLEAQQIAGYKLPERLELRDALPRNPVGKILKRQLRDEMRTPRP